MDKLFHIGCPLKGHTYSNKPVDKSMYELLVDTMRYYVN